jgi:hypothetical protein
MIMLDTSTLIQSIIDLLTEVYAGAPDPSETWFIDNEPDSGILGTLASISAIEASTSVDGSGGVGTTIAANVEHLRWSLANANAALRGETYNSNWSESWTMHEATEVKWGQLRQELQGELQVLLDAIKIQEHLPGDFLNGVLALIPHAAFHLGLIRQMIERVRSSSSMR